MSFRGGPEGGRAQAEPTQDPPGGPQVPVAACPQRGQRRAAPRPLQASAARAGPSTSSASTTSGLLSLANTVRTVGGGPEAGAGGRGLGRGGPAVAHPVLSVHLLAMGVGARPGSPGLGRWQGPRGAEGLQAAVHQQQVPQTRSSTFCRLGWEGFSVLFPVCRLSLLLLRLFRRAGSRQGASRSFSSH